MTPKTKWMFAVLALSLAGNLFAAGVWLGKELRPDRGPRSASPAERIDFNLRRLSEVLPEEQREHIRRIFRENRTEMRNHFRITRENEQRIRDILVAETVDSQALQAAMIEHQQNMGKLRDPMMTIMTDVIAKLDQETRLKLVEEIWNARKVRHKFMRRGPGGPGMPPPMGPSEDGFPGDGPPPPPGEEGPGSSPQ
jgi:uncharacterized membrane protein